MADSVTQFLWPLAQVFLWIALYGSPVMVVLWFISRRRKAYAAEAKEPFADMPLRPAGELSRLKGEAYAEEAFENFLFLTVTCSLAGLATALTPPPHRASLAIFTGLAVIAASAWVAPKIFRSLRRFWDYRLGSIGERLVGEELSQLLANGYRVFHDVQFDNFNIDHVVVGAAGVFVVETKTFRKRTPRGGKAAHEVVYDGRSLVWPWGVDNRALDQAERNARTVAEWLTRTTGESVSVQPMVTILGWWVERTKKWPARVTVVSSKGLHRFFPLRVAHPIPESQLRRIAFHLTERCRAARNQAKSN